MVVGNKKQGNSPPKAPKGKKKQDGQGKGKNHVNKGRKKSGGNKRPNKGVNAPGGRIGVDKKDVFPSGERAIAQNERKALKIQEREFERDVANLAGSIINSSIGERTEDLFCYVNPNIVGQYIWGVIMSPLAFSTNYQDLQFAMSAWSQCMQYFSQMPGQYNDHPFPQAIVELRAALEPRRKGKYNFIPNWYGMNIMQQSINSSGIVPNNFGINYFYPTDPNVSGFATTQSVIPLLPNSELDKFFAKFASVYKPINYHKWVDNPKDASAFAFDIAGAELDGGVSSGNSMAFCAGFNNSGTRIWCRQSGVAGLEVKIRRQHLAALRVTTVASRFNQDTAGNTVNNVRRGLKYLRCDTTPSVLGWNYGKRIAGRVQLKPVPNNSVAIDMRKKVEAVVEVKDTSASNPYYAQWIALFNVKEIQLLTSMFIKLQSLQYSGAYFGTALLVNYNGTVTVVDPMKNEYHPYTAIFNNLRFPEMLLRCLGSQKPFLGKYSTIIPWRTSVAPLTVTPGIIADGAYVGTTDPSSMTIPTIEESYSCFTKWNWIISKWRQFEMKLETRCVMAFSSRQGPTMLDMTCVQNAANNGLMSLAAQRNLETEDVNAFFSCPGYLTYDATDQNTYQNREYGQFNRFDCGGLDLPSTVQADNIYDGIVLNGFTSNIADGTGTNHPVGAGIISNGVPTPMPSSFGGREEATLKPAVQKLLTPYPHNHPAHPLPFPSVKDRVSQLITPMWGRYCGAGWSAGQYSGTENPKMEGGRYLEQPINREDAACKKHDEGYYWADYYNTPEKKKDVDKEFVRQLDDISSKEGLSGWGKVAQWFFRAGNNYHKDDL